MSAIQPAGTAERREEPVIVRCPRCGGPGGISTRQARRTDAICRECAYGWCVPVSAYHGWWTARFSREEIAQMAKAIWG